MDFAARELWNVNWLWDKIGYLQGTAFPTWEGNTALTGHVVLPSGLPGPFARLNTLSWGDEIYIYAFGMKYSYAVRQAFSVDPQDPSPLQHEEYDWVTLITCERYSPTYETYRFRRVVRAVLVDVSPE